MPEPGVGSNSEPTGEYQVKLANYAADLRALRIRRGNPSLKTISARTRGGRELAPSSISETLNGKRQSALESLMSLVRALLARDEEGRPGSAAETAAALDEWKRRWMDLEALKQRVPLGRAVAPAAVPTPPRAVVPAQPAHPAESIAATADTSRDVRWRLLAENEPLPWAARTVTVPKLPGATAAWPASLRRLLTELDGSSGEPSAVTEEWVLGPGLGMRSALPGLARAGILDRSGAQFTPSAAGRLWRETDDPAVLIHAIHIRVRFVGELVHALAEQPLTHSELLEIARTRYAMGWDSEGPVRDRTNWLRALGLADLFDGQVHLTNLGREVGEVLVPGAIEWEQAAEPAELPEPPPAVATLLQGLDADALRRRPYASAIYVPGSQSNEGRLEALRIITEAAIPAISDPAFVDLILDRFPGTNSPSSARTARDTAKALGLIRRISSTAWAATPAGQAWIATDQPVDLARIAHAHLGYFGEILHDLNKGNTVADLVYGLGYSGGPTIPASAVRARLELLLACGLVLKTSPTTYRTSALGSKFRASVPCRLPLWDLPSAAEPTLESAPEATEPVTPAPPTGEMPAADLRAAARHDVSPEALHSAVFAALAHLGMSELLPCEAENCDGHIRFGVGTNDPILPVVVWHTGRGTSVDDLASHRAETRSDATLIVAPSGDQRLEAFDKDPKTALVPTDTLADAVAAQSLTPLTPLQLIPLVAPGLRAGKRKQALQRAWDKDLRQAELERILFEILTAEARDPLDDGWLDLPALRRELRSRQYPADEAEVAGALAFLSSPRIAVVRQSGTRFRALAGPETALQRVRALGLQWAAHQARR